MLSLIFMLKIPLVITCWSCSNTSLQKAKRVCKKQNTNLLITESKIKASIVSSLAISNNKKINCICSHYMCSFHLSVSSFTKTMSICCCCQWRRKQQMWKKQQQLFENGNAVLITTKAILLSSWDVGESHCNWNGVACEESGSHLIFS